MEALGVDQRPSIVGGRGSGGSPRYLSVVEGRGAMVLPSLKLLRGVLRVLGDRFEICLIMTRPSSDDSSAKVAGHSSKPLASTAMHCTTSLLKWIWRRSIGDVMPEDDDVVRVPPRE